MWTATGYFTHLPCAFVSKSASWREVICILSSPSFSTCLDILRISLRYVQGTCACRVFCLWTLFSALRLRSETSRTRWVLSYSCAEKCIRPRGSTTTASRRYSLQYGWLWRSTFLQLNKIDFKFHLLENAFFSIFHYNNESVICRKSTFITRTLVNGSIWLVILDRGNKITSYLVIVSETTILTSILHNQDPWIEDMDPSCHPSSLFFFSLRSFIYAVLHYFFLNFLPISMSLFFLLSHWYHYKPSVGL